MIQLRNISLHFGGQDIFNQINLTIDQTDRIGLAGRNGAGKSTLLKAIVGSQQLDGGSISIAGGCRVAYMPQEVVMNSTKTILEEAISAHKEIGKLQTLIAELEPKVEAGDADAVHEYGDATQRLAEMDVDGFTAKVKRMLNGLGFTNKQFDEPVTSLSVGWQMRIILAKLLLQDADFYLFDEPTNHLDIVAKDWFLEFLKESSFGFLLVCHERLFLDALCSKTFELDRGKGTLYQGGYSDFEVQKEHALETLEMAYRQQQKEIKQKKQTIERFRAKSSKAKMAKSMQKSLDKIDRITLPQDIKTVNFKFAETKRSGKVVLEVQNVSHSFGDKQIFKDVTFNIERGEKVAVVAPNGGGKTTLFNLLCKNLELQQGNISLGYNVDQTVFEQEQHKVLDPNKTVVEEVMDGTRNKTEEQMRKFLGAFLFGRDEVKKKTKVLSGGERNRVSMVKVLLQDANFLLLDEPTNHLDIPSKDILLRALTQFQGTILFVSHDHDFVNKLATRVLELNKDGIRSYFGNYDSYLAQKHDAERIHEEVDSVLHAKKNITSGKADNINKFELKKKIQKCERKIINLEKDIEKINESFADIEYGTDAFVTAQKKLTKLERELASVSSEWEDASSKMAK